MKLVTVIGARPQFIKAAAVSRVVRDSYEGLIEEVIIHTGQHYDKNMSDVFFNELDIPVPKYNLNVSGGRHGEMTGRMLEGIESLLLKEKPDYVLVYGDTNSTLAAALAAVKLHIPVAHVEAGLRSFNMKMPEEINRVVVDRVSSLLFCPTETGSENLARENVLEGVHVVGDVMFDAALFYEELSKNKSKILEKHNLSPNAFVLATCHRAENTDSPERLLGIISALGEIAESTPIVLPLHPRTKALIASNKMEYLLEKVTVTDPCTFLDMIALEQAAKVIITDSGGVQKEAYFYQTPCITMRDETEWVETVASGWNQLVGANKADIVSAFESRRTPSMNEISPYGDGNAASKILNILKSAI